jgi:hypothetical protein
VACDTVAPWQLATLPRQSAEASKWVHLATPPRAQMLLQAHALSSEVAKWKKSEGCAAPALAVQCAIAGGGGHRHCLHSRLLLGLTRRESALLWNLEQSCIVHIGPMCAVSARANIALLRQRLNAFLAFLGARCSGHCGPLHHKT